MRAALASTQRATPGALCAGPLTLSCAAMQTAWGAAGSASAATAAPAAVQSAWGAAGSASAAAAVPAATRGSLQVGVATFNIGARQDTTAIITIATTTAATTATTTTSTTTTIVATTAPTQDHMHTSASSRFHEKLIRQVEGLRAKKSILCFQEQ